MMAATTMLLSWRTVTWSRQALLFSGPGSREGLLECLQVTQGDEPTNEELLAIIDEREQSFMHLLNKALSKITFILATV